jgi:hypothetical protein
MSWMRGLSKLENFQLESHGKRSEGESTFERACAAEEEDNDEVPYQLLNWNRLKLNVQKNLRLKTDSQFVLF